MKFEILRASGYLGEQPSPVKGAEKIGENWFVEINSMEELKALYANAGSDLIINFHRRPNIWIYDDYME